MMRPLRATVAVVSVAFLAACGGGGGGGVDAPASASPTAGLVSDEGGGGGEDSQEVAGVVSSGSPLGDANRDAYLEVYTPEELEGIAWAGDAGTEDGSFVEYPDGLRVDFVGVEVGSAPISEEEGDLDPTKSLVRVSLAVSNSGPDALPVDGGYIPFRVFEGENLVEVDSHVGYFGEEDDLYSANDAAVVAPGSSLDVYQSFEVDPGVSLEVELNPDFFGAEHTPFVFYGVTAP